MEKKDKPLKTLEDLLDTLPPERRKKAIAEGERLCEEYRKKMDP